ncbi:MAG: zf-TFIIB domain-containing protein [Deltaproteobacteria bacterium]|nr:zf-TFIIB domain-containing protein [Deltaproteobacteria bacterium]
MPSAVCLGCGARIDDDAPCACESLGQNPYRDAAPRSVSLGGCPRCGPPLVQVDYGGTPLDECTACAGVFVDAWILDRLVDARDARISLAVSLPVRARHRESEVRYLKCPRCAAQMNRKIFGRSSGIVVDVCKSDGIWFDAGELVSVLEFIEGGGLERARERELAERAEEARRDKVRRDLERPSILARTNASVSSRSELASELVAAIVEWWGR